MPQNSLETRLEDSAPVRPPSPVYRFADLVLDPGQRRLQRGQETIRLSKLSFALLRALVEAAPDLVTHDQLAQRTWGPKRIVTPENLSQRMSLLRQALGDHAQHPRYIEGVRGEGYRLVPEVEVIRDITVSSRRLRLRGPYRHALAALLASIAFLISGDELNRPADQPSTPPAAETAVMTKTSIAVLPFANISDDPSQQHFADGLSEEILNSLSAIDDLRIVSRTSSFAVRGGQLPMTEIADILKVTHILRGSVRRARNRVRVTAQLIDAGLDSQLWSTSYDRELTLDNILEIQAEIANRVAEALQLELIQRDSESLADGPGTMAALDLYHDGMFYVRQIEIDPLVDLSIYEQAIETLSASIEADPDWAPPHAALGRVYHFWKDAGDTAEKLRLSKVHVMDAIRLDSEYGSAYESLAYILTVQGDFDGAMRAADRARSLGEDASWARALLLMHLGRFDEAIDEFRKAVTQDPLAVGPRFQLVLAYSCAGRYAEVREALEGHVQPVGDSPFMRMLLADAYVRMGDVERGLQMANDAAEAVETDVPVAVLFARAGEEERARSVLDAPEIADPADLFDVAAAAIALGEEERALTLLEQAADLAAREYQSNQLLVWLQCSPETRSLAGTPRYEALLDRLGLPD